MIVLPPSPKSQRFHVPPGLYQLVPLSCVPPMVKNGSIGCVAMLWHGVALRPVVLRLVNVAPPSIDFQMPPSLPSQTMLGSDGAYTMACASACMPMSATPPAENVAPPSVEREYTRAQVPLPAPPMRMWLAFTGLTAIGRS